MNFAHENETKAGGRHLNTRALSFEDIQRIVTFLINFAEQHALVLLGRVPGFKRDDVKLLPSSETKASIWRKYSKTTKDEGHTAAGVTTFKSIWKSLCFHIVKTKPMSDLCFECQKNNYAVYKSANLSDSDKSSRLKKQEIHLMTVTRERSVYQEEMESSSKETVRSLGINELGQNKPCSREMHMHYSLDFAQ
ncbi:hypothetical protein SNE40_002279 [Patella caerulea]|uniref:Uncharacterized protein n=1 Tax=Patella caerulea TaxID=87958 RepID=A0AAN8PZQ0_PATCE